MPKTPRLSLTAAFIFLSGCAVSQHASYAQDERQTSILDFRASEPQARDNPKDNNAKAAANSHSETSSEEFPRLSYSVKGQQHMQSIRIEPAIR